MSSGPSHFVVMATGQIEGAKFEGHDSLYCRYAFSMGEDWTVMKGVEEGITQLSSASGASAEGGHVAVWNFPIDPIKQCSETLTHHTPSHGSAHTDRRTLLARPPACKLKGHDACTSLCCALGPRSLFLALGLSRLLRLALALLLRVLWLVLLLVLFLVLLLAFCALGGYQDAQVLAVGHLTHEEVFPLSLILIIIVVVIRTVVVVVIFVVVIVSHLGNADRVVLQCARDLSGAGGRP